MRFDSLSILATFVAAGLQIVAAEDAPEHRERPRYLRRDVKRNVQSTPYEQPEGSTIESRNTGGIASFLNGLGDAANSEPAEPTTSSMNGKEVVVVVSKDREGQLHTLTTRTRMVAQPTDHAVTSTVEDDEPPSSPKQAPSTPSSAPATTTEESKKGLDLGGDVNNLLNGDTDSKTDTASSAPASPSSAPAPSTKDSGNLLNLGADVNAVVGGSDSKTTAASSASETQSPAPAPSTKDSGNLLNLGADVNAVVGGPDSKTAAASSASETKSSVPAPSNKDSGNLLNLGGAVNNLLGDSTSTTAAGSSVPGTPLPTATSTKDSKNLLDIGGAVNNLLGDDSTTATGPTASMTASTTAAPATKDSGDILGLGKGVKELGNGVSKVLNPASNAATDSSTPLATGASGKSTTADKNLVEQLLGDKSPSTTSASSIPVNVPASPSATPSPAFDPVGGLADGVSDLLNGTSNTQSLVATPSSPLTIPKPNNSLGGVPTASIPLAGSPTNQVGSVPVPHAPSTGPSGKPLGSGAGVSGAGVSGAGASGSMPTPTGLAQESSKAIPAPSSTPVPQSPESSSTGAVVPQTTSTSRPSSTESDWMPSSILVLPTHSASETTSTNTNGQSEPTSLPGSITPNNVSEPPENSLLLQLGFDGSLPWSFVATTPLSTSQIFEYVPKALVHALPKFGAEATMFALEPYYNWKQTGYNATIAVFYFPRDGLDALKKLHSNPNSALYKDSDDQAVATLMTMIDPTIPLVFNGNTPSDSDGSHGSGDGNDDGDDDNNNGSNVDGGSGSSGKGNASAAGIATGAVAGAAAYGAAMFWVARRYRKRRQLHQRASSTGDAMSQNSAAASAAGAGSQRTARSQMISAPVMAENSLGWN